jgi:hypothetical protein
MGLMLTDEDPDVRKSASLAVSHLDDLEVDEAEALASSVLDAADKSESLGLLLHTLVESGRLLPNISMRTAEMALAELELGASSNVRGVFPDQIVGLVLRIYRQADGGHQEICLDMIDRLAMIRASDLDRSLDTRG